MYRYENRLTFKPYLWLKVLGDKLRSRGSNDYDGSVELQRSRSRCSIALELVVSFSCDYDATRMWPLRCDADVIRRVAETREDGPGLQDC